MRMTKVQGECANKERRIRINVHCLYHINFSGFGLTFFTRTLRLPRYSQTALGHFDGISIKCLFGPHPLLDSTTRLHEAKNDDGNTVVSTMDTRLSKTPLRTIWNKRVLLLDIDTKV